MNITKLTESFIAEHPSIKDCLKKRMINYSSLARQICKELNIKSFDAVLVACRRCSEKLKQREELEKRIVLLLKKSRIEIRNRIMAVVLEKGISTDSLISLEKGIKKSNEELHIIEGANAITLITSQEFLERIRELFRYKTLRINKDLAEVIIKTSTEIENTPGVVSYLYSLLGEHGINIVETMSCWTDTIFIIDEKDVAAVLRMLSF